MRLKTHMGESHCSKDARNRRMDGEAAESADTRKQHGELDKDTGCEQE